MKKLLAVFGSITLIPTVGLNIVACNSKKKNNVEKLLLELQNENKTLKDKITEAKLKLGNVLKKIDDIAKENYSSLENIKELFNNQFLKLTFVEIKDGIDTKMTKRIFLVHYNKSGTDDETRFIEPGEIKDLVAVPKIEEIPGFPKKSKLAVTLFHLQLNFVKEKMVAISKVIEKTITQKLQKAAELEKQVEETLAFIRDSKQNLKLSDKHFVGKNLKQILDIISLHIKNNKSQLDKAEDEFTDLEKKFKDLEEKISDLWDK